MKSVLGIVGSPRKKGNTHVLVSTILDGAAAEGARTETLLLKNKAIHECNGCHTCWKGKECNKKDDMNDIYPLIAGNDVLVFGTPVYWYGPTALIKALIDRFVYFNCPENREQVRGKQAAIAVPFEEEDPETADLVVAFFERSLAYLEMDLAGKIIVPGVTARGEVRDMEDIMAQARRLGRRLAHDG